MPGTTYTRAGGTRDTAGRLADFARFAVDELDEIQRALHAGGDRLELGTPVAIAERRAEAAMRELGAVADLLAGFTTADD